MAQTRLEEEFRRFHEANPHVWEKFRRFTFQAIDAGREHLGVAMVWERLRWFSAFETKGEQWKLNNNHRAYYARMFHEQYPHHDGFFRTRRVAGEDSGPDAEA